MSRMNPKAGCPAAAHAEPTAAAGAGLRQLSGWIPLILWAGAITLYFPALRFGFVLYDDFEYVGNWHVAGGFCRDNLMWAFTSLHGDTDYWHPLTWISHQILCEFFPSRAGAHHLTNVLLHAAAGVLLYRFLDRVTQRAAASFFVAALFLAHPLHVESVVWVAERKDVLSAVFWMATLSAYLTYIHRPDWKRYLRVLLLFTCGLMSKPSVVTLPLNLLLLDYWPLRRDRNGSLHSGGLTFPRRLIVEKVPFVALSLVIGLATIRGQHELSVLAPWMNLTITERLSSTLIGYVWYIGKMFWPSDLSVIYLREPAVPAGSAVAAGTVLAGITWWALRTQRSRPYVAVGWLWFLIVLLPMIGVAGYQSTADRYSYISLVGLFIAAIWLGSDLVKSRPGLKPYVVSLAGIVLCTCAVSSRTQLAYWRSDISLFEHAVTVTAGNWIAHHNLALAYSNEGRTGDAFRELAIAQRLDPANPLLYETRGGFLLDAGKLREAEKCFLTELVLNPGNLFAHERLAQIYSAGGDGFPRPEQAIENAELVVRKMRTKQPKIYETLAGAYAAAGQYDKAISALDEAIALARGFHLPIAEYAHLRSVYGAAGEAQRGQNHRASTDSGV